MLWTKISRDISVSTPGPIFIERKNVSKPQDSGLDFSNRYVIWQASRQQRDACQISERCDLYNIQTRGFEAS